MNTKQTPEQAASEALRCYADYMGYSPNQYAARQTIIKAFQDRERLLEACELVMQAVYHISNDDPHIWNSKARHVLMEAIEKAKS